MIDRLKIEGGVTEMTVYPSEDAEIIVNGERMSVTDFLEIYEIGHRYKNKGVEKDIRELNEWYVFNRDTLTILTEKNVEDLFKLVPLIYGIYPKKHIHHLEVEHFFDPEDGEENLQVVIVLGYLDKEFSDDAIKKNIDNSFKLFQEREKDNIDMQVVHAYL